jgi:periplasmic divalent cation tolerance protein
MPEYIIILTTVPDEQEGRKMARLLVQDHLAACVTLSPASLSIYRWEGAITEEKEHILIIKTRRDLFPQIEKKIDENHPYDIPEIIAFPVVEGSRNYLDWVEEETKKN